MFLASRPDRSIVQRFIDDHTNDGLSYPEVGATQESPPSGYNIDHSRIKIGDGSEAMERAQNAIRNWKMFEMAWIELMSNTTPIEKGRTVSILARHFGFYSLNAARIVYVLDETGEVDRYGFAYGTLTEHAEIGEERFSVEFHAATGEVWYDLYAFSRPGALLAKIGYPVSRYFQKAFARDSKLAMYHAVSGRPASRENHKVVLE